MAQLEFKRKWDFESAENYDNYMKAIGIGIIKRRIVAICKPQISIEIDGEYWKIESAFNKHVLKFKLGEEIEETTTDGRKCMSTFTFDGGKLHQVQRATKSGEQDSVIDFFVEKEKLKINMVSNKVKSEHIYKRETKIFKKTDEEKEKESDEILEKMRNKKKFFLPLTKNDDSARASSQTSSQASAEKAFDEKLGPAINPLIKSIEKSLAKEAKEEKAARRKDE